MNNALELQKEVIETLQGLLAKILVERKLEYEQYDTQEMIDKKKEIIQSAKIKLVNKEDPGLTDRMQGLLNKILIREELEHLEFSITVPYYTESSKKLKQIQSIIGEINAKATNEGTEFIIQDNFNKQADNVKTAIIEGKQRLGSTFWEIVSSSQSKK